MINCDTKVFESEIDFQAYGKSVLEQLDHFKCLVSVDHCDIYAISHDEEVFRAVETEICTKSCRILLLSELFRALSMDLITGTIAELFAAVAHPDDLDAVFDLDEKGLFVDCLCTSPIHFFGLYTDPNLNRGKIKVYKMVCGKCIPPALLEYDR